MRRTVATLTALLAIATGGGVAAAQTSSSDTGPNNLVWSQTTGTNATDAGSSVAVGSYRGDNLQSTNVARSDSTDCTDCRTVAVAVQAVFATAHPATSEPKNYAIALNQNCTRCTTYAYAYQYVVTTNGPVHLSHRTRRMIARVRQEVYAVAHSDLAPADMDARLNTLTAEFKSDIDQAVKDSGDHGHGHVRKDEQRGQQ